MEYRTAEGKTEHGRGRVIDFNREGGKDKNQYLVVTHLWVLGLTGYLRPDVLIYVNGLPLVFIELTNSKVNVRNAYEDNLARYKAKIPYLFHYNAFCILSNALDTLVGSFNANWEYFFVWLHPDDKKEKINRKSIEKQGINIERVLDGLFPHERLLDYIQNFIVYYNETEKIIAQNHQFIGVNKALKVFQERQKHKKKDKGKLGVF